MAGAHLDPLPLGAGHVPAAGVRGVRPAALRQERARLLDELRAGQARGEGVGDPAAGQAEGARGRPQAHVHCQARYQSCIPRQSP